jgi:hypothetical protein
VIGRDTDVCVGMFVLDYLEDGLQHTDHSAVRTVLAFGEPSEPIEMSEQLVSSVNDMNDHAALR